eukprot:jgi/Bigna1/145882/aug1.105_g20590
MDTAMDSREPAVVAYRNPHEQFRPSGIAQLEGGISDDSNEEKLAKKNYEQEGNKTLIEVAKQGLEEGNLVQKTVGNAVKTLTSAKESAKNMSSILKFGIEKFESNISSVPLLAPMVATISTKQEKVVGKVDSLLSYCYGTALKVGKDVYNVVDISRDAALDTAQKQAGIIYGIVVRAEWLDSVDKILNPAKMGALNAVASFKTATQKSWVDLCQKTNQARRSIHEITSDEYVEKVKDRMQEQWDEKLKEPVQELFLKAKEEFKKNGNFNLDKAKDVITSLQSVWEKKAIDSVKARVRPAQIAFNSITETYGKYRQISKEKGLKMSAELFIEEVKGSLEDAYDERLAPYLKAYYEAAKKYTWTATEMKKANDSSSAAESKRCADSPADDESRKPTG